MNDEETGTDFSSMVEQLNEVIDRLVAEAVAVRVGPLEAEIAILKQRLGACERRISRLESGPQ